MGWILDFRALANRCRQSHRDHVFAGRHQVGLARSQDRHRRRRQLGEEPDHGDTSPASHRDRVAFLAEVPADVALELLGALQCRLGGFTVAIRKLVAIAVAIAQGAREEREQEPGGAFPRHHLEFKKKYVSGHIRKGFPVSLVSVFWRRSRARRSRRLTRGKGW